MDHLGLVETVDGFGESIVIGIPDAADRRFDTSFSQDRVLPIEKEVGAQFLQRLLRKEDEAFLISFDVNVDLLQDFTNREPDIRKGMEAARVRLV